MSLKPIKPIYARTNAQGGWDFGVSEEDFARLQAGYGCTECLEPFSFPRAVCPVCQTEQFMLADTPPEWRYKRR